MRVTVIGAGVAGLVAAVELASRGAEVTVLERGETFGAGACSWAAGGMIAPWCEHEAGEEDIARLGVEAVTWWPKTIPAAQANGTLVLAQRRDASELARFSRAADPDRFEKVDVWRIASLEPDLAGRFEAGLFFGDEAHVDPREALPALAAKLRERGGEIRFGVEARVEDAEGDVVLDARGLSAREQLSDLRGVRGEMILLRTDEVSLKRPIRLLHPRIPLYVVPRAGGVFMIGATAIESSSRAGVSARSAVELLNAAYALHPAFGEAEIVETCSQVRPAFPDNLPRVSREGRVVRLNGFYRNGFLLAPALGRQAADEILGASDETDRQRLSA